MNAKVRLLLALVLAGAVVTACALPGGSGGNAALVNGKTVSMSDFNTQVRIVQDSMVAQGVDPKTEDGKATIEQMRSDILSQMIDIELMRQAALKEGIAVTDADVNARMAEIKTDAGGDEAFKKSLTDAKLTEAEFRTLIVRDQIIYERLYDKVASTLPKTAEQVHARHILVDTEKSAQDILARLNKGEDFVALAKELSTDTQSKDSGGDLGFFPRGVMDQTFEDAVFKLNLNQSAMVKTDYGYHVVQVTEKDANRAVGPEILQALGDQAINTFMENLRTQAKIERLVKFTVSPTPSQ